MSMFFSPAHKTMRKCLSAAMCTLFCLGILGNAYGQFRPQGQTSTQGPVQPVNTGLSSTPTEAEMKSMTINLLKRPEHKEVLQLLAKHQPVKKGFPNGYRWDLVRTRGWTAKQPYVRSFLMNGNYVSAVVNVPIKVVKGKMTIDNSRDLHVCISNNCPICAPQYDVDSVLIGCITYGVTEDWERTHPNPRCESYKRKPYGELVKKVLPPMPGRKK